MHEPALAEVDADVRALLAFLVEEQQIAAAQLGDLDGPRGLALLLGVVRQRDAGLLVAVEDEAAAIEAGRRGAAVAVWLADHLLCMAGGTVGGRCARARGGARRRRAAGERQQQDRKEESHAALMSPMLPALV